ncbi:TadB Flp pilus assembly protein TadB [Candidatus Nanopelagicaceae bacterium]
MKLSIAIPTFFAASGALWLISNSGPKSEIKARIATSRDRESTAIRLAEIGKVQARDFETFRTRQISISAITGVIAFILVLLSGRLPTVALILSAVVASISFIWVDRDLSKKVKLQRRMIDAEFPAVIEMYSLALSAGETPLVAMERIATSATGSLSKEFATVVAQVKDGKAFHLALDEMGRGIDSVSIRRFVDSLIIATLRGTPLIEVLQRHAEEARQSQRNRVMGAAAKAEISMMIPVVFLILPISILFALWPSLANLNLFTGA